MKTIGIILLACSSAFAQSVTIAAPAFTGSGINDASSSGQFSLLPTNAVYVATISSAGAPDHFTWTKNGGTTSAPIAITGGTCVPNTGTGWQLLADGVKICWLVSTGHTAGDSWIITATARGSAFGVNFIQSGPGAVPRTVEDKVRETISVKDWGAVGDGVHDDSVAAEYAKRYACGLTGGAGANRSAKLFFPVPDVEYLVSTGLTICARLEIEGFRSAIHYTGTGPFITIPASGQGAIHGMNMRGDNVADTWGIKCAGTGGSGCIGEHIFDNYIYNFGGIYPVSGGGIWNAANSEKFTVDHNSIFVNGTGVLFTAGGDASSVDDNDFLSQTGRCIDISNTVGTAMLAANHNNATCTGGGIRMQGTGSFVANFNEMEFVFGPSLNASSAAYEFLAGSGAIFVTAIGNYAAIHGNAKYCMYVDDSSATSYVLANNCVSQQDAMGPVYSPVNVFSAASWSGGVATFTSITGTTTGQLVSISGAAPLGWNVKDCAVTVIDSSHFSCPVATNPGAWAGGGVIFADNQAHQYGIHNGNGNSSNHYSFNGMFQPTPHATLYEFPDDIGVQEWPFASSLLTDSALLMRATMPYAATNTMSAGTWTLGVATITCTGCDVHDGQLVQIVGATPPSWEFRPGECRATRISLNQFSCPKFHNPGTWVSGGSVSVVRTTTLPWGDVRLDPYDFGTFMSRKQTVNCAAGPPCTAGTGQGEVWGHQVQNSTATDASILGETSSNYTSTGGLGWLRNSATFLRAPLHLLLGAASSDNVGLDIWGKGIGIGCHPAINQTGVCLEPVQNSDIAAIPVGSFAWSPDTAVGTCAGGGTGAWVYSNPGSTLVCSDNVTGTLPNTGVSAGTCGDATNYCAPTFDAKGRATAATTYPVTLPSTGATAGTATSSSTTGISVSCTSSAVPSGGGTPSITCSVSDPGHGHTQVH